MDLSLFTDIHSEDDLRNKIRNEIIKYVNQDGIKTVDPNYIEFIKNIDTFQLGKDISPFQDQDSLKNTLFSMQLQTYIKEEIALLTGDLSSTSKPQEFLDTFKKLGFEIIFQRSIEVERNVPFKNGKEYMQFVKSNKGFIENNSNTEEIKLGEYNYSSLNFEYILFNKDNSFLIHMDTYDGSLNQVRLLGMIKNINPDYQPSNSNITKKNHYTEKYTIDMDLLELPIDSYWKLLSNSTPVKEWSTFSVILDSCLDEQDPISTLDKVKNFPEEVLSKIVFKQTEYSTNIYINSEKEKKYQSFFLSLSEEDVQDYILRSFLFKSDNFEESRKYLFNDSIILKANQQGYILEDLIDRHTYTTFNKNIKKNADLFLNNTEIFIDKLKNIDIELFKFVNIENLKNISEQYKKISVLLPIVEEMKSIYDKQIKMIEPKRNKITLN